MNLYLPKLIQVHHFQHNILAANQAQYDILDTLSMCQLIHGHDIFSESCFPLISVLTTESRSEISLPRLIINL